MKFQVYRDGNKEWRWRLVAKNGNILADSGEGYKRKSSCIKILETARKAKIVVDELE